MKKWIIVLLTFTAFTGLSQARVHLNAHAHNDYEHKRPLLDALDNGFISVEADVHLKEGKLLVSHNQPGTSAKTLERLYLGPLDSIQSKSEGWIYSDNHEPVLLLIDIKTSGIETFQQLLKTLVQYEHYLTTPARRGAVQILISGNRPVDLILHDPNHLSSIDGRPEDIGKGFSSDVMPLIRENFNKVIKWKGTGTLPPEEFRKLKELADKVHAENKKLRLWAIPDQENVWSVLLKAGVDLINTDRLPELNLFLNSKNL
jgi:hypothetical protein